jgi:hypothetical protein
MPLISTAFLKKFVEKNIPAFHDSRLKALAQLKLDKLLRNKNPYLFRAKGVGTPRELVQSVLDAYLSSQEETLLGGFLEELAIAICAQTCGGVKSGIPGVDLEFTKNGEMPAKFKT